MAAPDASTKRKTERPAPPPSSYPHLRVLTGSRAGELIPLQVGTFRVGRGETAGLRLEDDGVSRDHAEISVTPQWIEVRDLDSTNGTFVNGELQSAARLQPGDRVHVGPDAELQLIYVLAKVGVVADARATVASRGPGISLSPREIEVAQLVAEGLTNTEIGQRLHISRRTVTTHLVKIYRRLGIGSRAELTRYVLEQDLGRTTPRGR